MSLFGSLLKTALDVATLPLAVAKDVVTGGGIATDEDPATPRKLGKIADDIEDVIDDAGDL